MWMYFLRRILAVPPLLLVISFLSYVLLQAAPGDFFSQLETDQKKSLDFIMQLRTSVGKAVEVSPERRADTLGNFSVADRSYGFDARGRLLREGRPADIREELQLLKKF